MLDERWDDDTEALADALRKVLAGACPPDVVREAEATGTVPTTLADALDAFGVWTLPEDPAMRTVASWELGRALAPVDVDRLVTVDGDGGERQRWLLDAARMVGAAEGLLTLGVAYAKQRHQFGHPIGAFQAVAHRLVDAATDVDGAGLLVRKAAWVARTSDDGSPSWTFARMARWKATDAARQTATHVHQVMGGYGFAMEYDCQLFSRRIRRWSSRLGRPDDALEELGRDVAEADRRDGLRWLWHHEEGLPLPRWATDLDDHHPLAGD